ncbi:MAG TPA: amidase family protein, partial [Gemmatimonadaceae bacterium]|nr:amidase family protein [Gemmatimonadaceae bacterium]
MAPHPGRQAENSSLPSSQRLDRRTFLHSAAAGVAAVAAGRFPLFAQASHEVTPGVASGTSGVQGLPAPFALDEVTIGQLQDWMTSGRYTSRALVELYLGRIEAIDDAGPKLRSIIETNPEAVAIADALDAERKARGPRGPLHGIPILLKDVVDTADRMHTTAGSLALAGSFAPRDAFVAARLRAAGAILLGKTNLSEWSNCRSTNATSGWSARGGLTKNPYVLDRSACGSSSGSGVAIAANLAVAGVGAETHGSIACPASANSLVGIKPTVGLLSRAGVIPVSYSQDSPGPMCRTVRDAAILLSAMTGVDTRDLATEAGRGHAHADYT